MSNSNNQKMRRNAASPSTRQGPLRATQQFALVGGSPSRKQHQVVSRQTPTSSPTSKSSRHTKARSHSETGFVSERRSPTPNYKGWYNNINNSIISLSHIMHANTLSPMSSEYKMSHFVATLPYLWAL